MNLVTGATGIVGSHVVLALLLDNQPVTACKRSSSSLTALETLFQYYKPDYKELLSKVKWVDVDILDVFSLEEVIDADTNVYHCAGFVSFEAKDRKKLMAVNETGTKNVVDACLHKGAKALCHVSSIATIHNLDYKGTLNEEVFWKKSGTESDYAISKYNAEREVWRGMEEGLKALIVNPGLVLAPGFWDQSSSRIFDTCYKGNKFYTNGMGAYVTAMDVGQAITALMSKERFGERYILIENNYTFHNILSHIQNSLNRPGPVINASPGLLRMAAFFEGIFSFFSGAPRKITKSLVHAAFNKQLFSNSKIKKALGIEFTSTHQAIGEICRYYLIQKAKGKSSV